MLALPTLSALNAEWELIGDDRFERGPLLGTTARTALARVRNDPDAVLLTLVTAAQAGDQLAGRTVVQALLGKLVRMVVADRRLDLADLVAALWVRIATYPVVRRATKVAANLALDARKDVVAELRGLRVVEPSDVGEEPSAEQVLDAARELGLIDATSRAILGTVYGEGLASAQAAARHGTTATAVRWRCSRDVRVLAARSRELWEAIA